MLAAVLVAAVLAGAVPAPPDSGWSFTDRVYHDAAGRRPMPEERSQRLLAPLALCVGFADPGLQDRVIEIDSPSASPLLRFVIAGADTLRPKQKSACPNVKPAPGAPRCYIAVLRLGGVGVPDSLRVVLANESTFWVHRWKGK